MERYSFPLIIEDALDITVPDNMPIINDFLSGKVSAIHGEDAISFLHISNIDIVPFIWLMMLNGNLDIYWDHADIYIRFDHDYIILNGQNIDTNTIEQLYKIQNKTNYNGVFKELSDGLFTYIKNKIANGIVTNDIIKMEIKSFKDYETELDNEFLKNNVDFPKILFLYEKMIRLKEKYTDERFYLKPQEDMDNYFAAVIKIRDIINNSHGCSYNYSVNKGA
jgi:hypothetical protein